MCRASADRVLSLYEDMQALDAQLRAPGEHRIVAERAADGRLHIEDLCIAESSGQILLEHFSAQIGAANAC